MVPLAHVAMNGAVDFRDRNGHMLFGHDGAKLFINGRQSLAMSTPKTK